MLLLLLPSAGLGRTRTPLLELRVSFLCYRCLFFLQLVILVLRSRSKNWLAKQLLNLPPLSFLPWID